MEAAVVPVGHPARNRQPCEDDAREAMHGPRINTLARSWMLTVLGVLYVGATLYGSYRFLFTATSFLSNDVFWPGFNASVGAVHMAAACNLALNGQQQATNVSLTDATFALASDTLITSMSVTNSRHYPRLLQYHRLTSIADGVIGVRSVPASSAVFVGSQYCWVDFDRRWSLAHTERRAERCLERYRDNAAMYLESLLRNVDWVAFIESVGDEFQIAIADELERTDEGLEFLDSLKMSASTTVEYEAALWKDKGHKHYTLGYHNMWQVGVDESVDLQTSLRLRTSFPLKSIEYEDVGRRERQRRCSGP